MACLTPKEDDKSYRHFDVENMQDASLTNGNTQTGSRRRKRATCLSPQMLLPLAALLLSLIALALGIYAAVMAKRIMSSPSDEDMYLTSQPVDIPRGWRAVNMFQGTGYFAPQQPMMYPRSDHRTLPIGNTVYLLGGLTNALKVEASEGNASAASAAQAGPPVPLVLNATVAYNTYTQSSTQKADMPQPRYRFCGAVLKGQLYVVGGVSAFEPADAPDHIVSDRVMRYDPGSDKWEVLPGKLKHPRSDCCAAAVGGKLIVAGGWTTNYADTLGSVEVFDPSAAGGGWSLLPNLTLPRGDCESVALDDRTMLVIGGVGPDGNFTSTVEALNTADQQPAWSPRASMSKPRGDFAAEALPGGRVIVMGGETSNGTATEFALYDVEEYQAAADTWVVKAPLPQARFRFDTAHVGDRVYVFGGQPTCSSKQDSTKQTCVKVALETVYGYFDVHYPEVYAVVKQ